LKNAPCVRLCTQPRLLRPVRFQLARISLESLAQGRGPPAAAHAPSRETRLVPHSESAQSRRASRPGAACAPPPQLPASCGLFPIQHPARSRTYLTPVLPPLLINERWPKRSSNCTKSAVRPTAVHGS
jgi:hypothetical protein